MDDKHPVIYEPHPVTPERKAELREKGYCIVDAQFAPPGWAQPKQGAPIERLTGIDVAPADMTASELRAELDAAGVEYVKHAPKANLVELVEVLRESQS